MKVQRLPAGLHLHFEPTAGIAGDMTIAALVDAGVPERIVTGAIRAVGLDGLRARFERRKRGGQMGRAFVVTWRGRPAEDDEHHHDAESDVHRSYRQIRGMLRRAKLHSDVRALAAKTFARLAEVEGALHGTPPDAVTFHEVGAWDSIADIVGAAAAIVWLAPASIGSVPPVVGTGSVRTAHGRLPVPAPATVELLRGIPMVPEGEGELTTPTGAALLATLVDHFGSPPPMRVRAVGYGAGTRELADRPNLLRVLVGEPVGERTMDAAADVLLLETNLDDMSPQLVGPLFDALFAAGAVDVWAAAILMKKGRPGLTVSALATADTRGAVEAAFFRNSTTLGLRVRPTARTVLARSFASVRTPWGTVRVKVAALDGEVLGASPEFEDCRRLALAAGAPVRDVLAAAAAGSLALRVPAPRRSKGPR